MQIGIIREGKVPPDFRVPLTPQQCAEIQKAHPELKIKVQSSTARCFTDEEYEQAGLPIVDDVSDCDILLGVKEVPIPQLIPAKTYFFFSHTIKKQPYNRSLLQAVIDKNIRLIDWECLTDDDGERVIAFGRWAGIVGAHNGMLAYGKRTATFELKPMHDMLDFAEAKEEYKFLTLPPLKVVITGTGRVANGSAEVMEAMGIERVSPEDFLNQNFEKPVFTQLGIDDMYSRPEGQTFDRAHYFAHPEEYISTFEPYTSMADMMINGIYWDERIPAFFSREDMLEKDFRIKVIADITCDIAPVASVPSTIRPSVIGDATYGYDPQTNTEKEPYQSEFVDVMAVDNLPNELPRDASEDFGSQFVNKVLPEVLKAEKSQMLYRASITQNGDLNEPFEYLRDWVEGKED